MSGQTLSATFFALKKRGRPGVLTALAGIYLLISLAVWGAYFALFWNAFAQLFTYVGQVAAASADGSTPDPEAFPFPFAALPALLAIIPFMLVYYIVRATFEAGCQRWMVRGEQAGALGFALDADAWRVYGVYWANFGLNMAVGFAGGIAALVLVGIAAAFGTGVSSAVQSVSDLALNVLSFYLAIRLGPAAATSIARRRFSFFPAWAVTRGRVLALLGSYIVLGLIFTLVVGAAFAAVASIVIAPFWEELSSAAQSENSQAAMGVINQVLAAPNSWPLLSAFGVVYAVSSVVMGIMVMGVNARVTLAAVEEGRIDGVTSAEIARTFD